MTTRSPGEDEKVTNADEQKVAVNISTKEESGFDQVNPEKKPDEANVKEDEETFPKRKNKK